MHTKYSESHDLVHNITGLPTSSVFGLLMSAASMVFGPITALQLPAPASYFMWFFIGMTVMFGPMLAVWEMGVSALIVSFRKHAVTWILLIAGLAGAVLTVLDFMGVFSHNWGII